MERRFKGTLVATATGAVMLTAASAEAAFFNSAGEELSTPFCGSSAETTTAGCGAFVGMGANNDFDDEVARLLTDAGHVDFANNFELTAKFESPGALLDSNGNPTETTVGNLTVRGTIFKDEDNSSGVSTGDEAVFGEWEYTSPGLKALAVKGGGGNEFALYVYGNFETFGNWSTEEFLSGGGDVTEVSFIQGVVPLPAAAWMMIGGLGLVAGVARKLRRPDAAAA